MKKTIDEYWKLFKEGSKNGKNNEQNFRDVIDRIKTDLISAIPKEEIKEAVKGAWDKLMKATTTKTHELTKDEVLQELWTMLQDKGKVTGKQSILNEDDKVWTKKLTIDLDDESEGSYYSVLSVTATSEDFSDALQSDMRVAVVNYQEQYCNNFAKELPIEKLLMIYDKLTGVAE